MKPYPKYKSSGVEWLGDVPEHWEVKRSDGIVLSDKLQVSPDLFAEKEVFHYSIPVVQEKGTGQLEEGSTIASAKQIVRKPVILVSKLNPRKATICLAKPKKELTLCSTEFVALHPENCDIRFLEYLVQTEIFRQGLDSKVQSVTRSHQRANPSDIYKFWNAWPRKDEQTAIAAFLDRETGRMDELVGKKKELIERLKEKRTALISRTVTRGLPAGTAAQYPQIAQIYAEEIQKQKNLRPSAKSADQLPENPPIKPSGIDWLGNVPEHWVVTRLDFVACVKARLGWKGLTASEYVPDGYIFLSTPNIKGEGEIDFTNVNFITADRYYESPEIMLQVGDVLIAKDGSTLGTTNVVRHLPAPATVNSSIAVLRPKSSIDSSFFFRWLTGAYMQCVIDSKKDGQGVPHLFQADIKKFSILLPPLPEQLAIAAYLDEETARLDALIAKVETAIERLQEYRTALITAAVTGKIDVREEVAV